MVNIDKVQEAFTYWRENKAHNNVKIPLYLRDMVRSLLPNYTKSDIRKILHLSGAQLYVMQQEQQSGNNILNNKIAATTDDGFIKVLPVINTSTTYCEVVLQKQNSTVVFKIPIDYLYAVIPAFKELL